MPSARQRFGTAAEDQAAEFLVEHGYTILDRHVTSRFGEIDIVAEDKEILVAVEVKARRSQTYGSAIESVTEYKIEKIAAALHEYLEEHGWQNRQFRIDVITIDRDAIQHHRSVG